MRDDLIGALHNCTVVAQNENSTPLLRIRAGKAAADLYSGQSNWSTAYKLLAAAVGLLSKIGIRALSWDDRQYVLRDLSGLSSLAACIALNAGQSPLAALALQEAGRGVIAGSIIDSRSDISDLKAADPALYKSIAAALFLLSSQENERDPADSMSTRSQKIRHLENLEMEIREKTNLKTFGLPFTPIDLMQLAMSDFVVSFNVTEYRSDAFIVTSDNTRVLQLPRLLFSDLKDFIQGLGTLTTGSVWTHQTRNERFRSRMKWLWEVTVHPVLDALNLITLKKLGALPRLWPGRTNTTPRGKIRMGKEYQ